MQDNKMNQDLWVDGVDDQEEEEQQDQSENTQMAQDEPQVMSKIDESR